MVENDGSNKTRERRAAGGQLGVRTLCAVAASNGAGGAPGSVSDHACPRVRTAPGPAPPPAPAGRRLLPLATTTAAVRPAFAAVIVGEAVAPATYTPWARPRIRRIRFPLVAARVHHCCTSKHAGLVLLCAVRRGCQGSARLTRVRLLPALRRASLMPAMAPAAAAGPPTAALAVIPHAPAQYPRYFAFATSPAAVASTTMAADA